MTKNDHLTTTRKAAVSIVSSQPTVPGTYVLLLIDVTERWNVPVAELLEREGLVLEDLLRSGFRLPRDCFARLIQQAISLTFGGDFNGFVFERSILESPLVMSDPVAARVAREQCKEELGRLGGGRSLLQQVRDLVFDEEMGFASIEEVAAKLNVTPRTLQRRLRAEGVVFRELVESMRQQHARRLLAVGQKSIGQVSDLLGYSDVTNFSRAFRRWTGRSPREYARAPG